MSFALLVYASAYLKRYHLISASRFGPGSAF
jgi:hypothetical protein